MIFRRLQNKFPPISLNIFNLILSIWFGVALNLSFYMKIIQLTPYQGIKAWLFLMATVIVVVSIYNLIFQLLQWKWNIRFFAVIFILLGGFSAYFVNSLGIGISADQIQNALQTDQHEVLDLLSWQFVLWSLGFVLLPLSLLGLVKIQTEALSKVFISKMFGALTSLVLAGLMLFTFYIDYAAIFREHRDLKGMISPQNVIASSISYYKKKAPRQNLPLIKYGEDAHLILPVSDSKKPQLMVLVVGETARAESFALNGYTRATNPELSKLDIINFSQVSSCGTATAVSVPCMFSGMPRQQYDEQLASHREGLLDIAQRAGYKVTWVDNNSGCKGVCNRIEQYEFNKSLKQKWCIEGECHDEILPEALQAYLASIPETDKTPRLIVLHQAGSHGPAYFKRSTAAYQPFQPTCNTNAIQGCSAESLINSYDNSIVYTDHVLAELIQTLEGNQHYQSALWYLSDHGESTGEHGLYLHGSPYAIAPSQQTHIPMLMWFSESWKQQHPVQFACLANQKQQNLSQDNLFPTLLSLLNIKSAVIQPQHDMLQQCHHLSGLRI